MSLADLIAPMKAKELKLVAEGLDPYNPSKQTVYPKWKVRLKRKYGKRIPKR